MSRQQVMPFNLGFVALSATRALDEAHRLVTTVGEEAQLHRRNARRLQLAVEQALTGLDGMFEDVAEILRDALDALEPTRSMRSPIIPDSES